MIMDMKNIAVLASGRGTNFQAIIDGVDSGLIKGRICCLITDNPSAYSIERAEKAGIPVKVIDFSSFGSRTDYNSALRRRMEETGADLFVLAGYMRLLDDDTVRQFPGKMINIHPALLPSFKGLHAHKQAIEYGVKISGCTVHFVDEEMDHGAIIAQSPVPVMDDDTEDSLAERILKEEHKALQRSVALFCEDLLRIENRKVKILSAKKD
ncbi:phosphoribosylglycinamide formyltransferase [Methanolacinia paynteri]|uniref:phosphoribosylglycinamide formyltransferase n=1 Tax=Methanolacinia paynteri TaxID=230356 RepID=UPI000A03A264|nr:phosphoribosylglycinamide formyltransferase [Methanolacinia paynteri]